MLRFVLPGLVVLLLAGCAAEAEQPEPPALELTGRVVDAANILSPEFEAELTARLQALEDETLVQLVVATTPSLDGYAIQDYSIDLARAWGIGDAERNDGLLLLVAPNERQVRIEVGYGLEKTVKDEEARFIIRDDILPHFEHEDYETGVSDGVKGLVREVTPVEGEKKAA